MNFFPRCRGRDSDIVVSPARGEKRSRSRIEGEPPGFAREERRGGVPLLVPRAGSPGGRLGNELGNTPPFSPATRSFKENPVYVDVRDWRRVEVKTQTDIEINLSESLNT